MVVLLYFLASSRVGCLRAESSPFATRTTDAPVQAMYGSSFLVLRSTDGGVAQSAQIE